MNFGDIFLRELREYRPDPPAQKRVLVVDDDQDFVQMLAESMNGLAEFVVANSPREAIGLVNAARPFARVVMDLRFPGGDSGVKALERIAGLLPGVPVTIISAFITEPMRAAAARHGFDVVLKSPGCVEELRKAL